MNDGGPAYPTRNPEQRYLSGGGLEVVSGTYEPGMSLRDHFASQALEGIVNGPAWQQGVQQMLTEASRIATACYIVADAMLKERAESGQ